MIDKKLAEGIVASNRKVDFCMNCAEAKQARRAKNKQDTSTSAPTDEPGATLCIDLKVDIAPDRLDLKHILTSVDHATNYICVYLLRKKSEVEGLLEDFVKRCCKHLRFHKDFGGDAVLYASYIRNYLPTRANADHASPIEALTGKVPDVSYILRFGAKCMSNITHAAGKSARKQTEKVL
ncbi:hypothetical protein PHMEG_00021500 [Phytophthora megakarya]|uniref:Uncharacterized protein n=1 Tax=Phytophthora megakarya TaxID=4795 RepID=A0A225VND2_9STRA|nr:hypothetical protein PHMEG_00021500 [Phytophthora megakarya]